ncbi:MAG TPA: hypothetical protein VEL07_16430 [Planctomycetota bacterium]|nr:hypothetical protein [Planctomycetota bacterium]
MYEIPFKHDGVRYLAMLGRDSAGWSVNVYREYGPRVGACRYRGGRGLSRIDGSLRDLRGSLASCVGARLSAA